MARIRRHNEYFNNTQGPVSNQVPTQTINTQSRFSIVCSGDLTDCGVDFNHDVVVVSIDLSTPPTFLRSICLYETSIMEGPGCN
jgi:hypothetical protein